MGVKANMHDWPLLQVGDWLIAKEDVLLKPHHAWFGYSGYQGNRRFTAGKAYQIVRIRAKSGVVFVEDDGQFTIPLDSFQGRRFTTRSARATQQPAQQQPDA